MFVTPASFAGFGRRLTRDAAERLARPWRTLLRNGVVLVIVGVRISSSDWSAPSLSSCLGALFTVEAVCALLTAARSTRGTTPLAGGWPGAGGVPIIGCL